MLTKPCLSHPWQVKLVVSGVTIAISLRKDTDGRLGLSLKLGPPRGVQGAMLSDVTPRLNNSRNKTLSDVTPR